MAEMLNLGMLLFQTINAFLFTLLLLLEAKQSCMVHGAGKENMVSRVSVSQSITFE